MRLHGEPRTGRVRALGQRSGRHQLSSVHVCGPRSRTAAIVHIGPWATDGLFRSSRAPRVASRSLLQLRRESWAPAKQHQFVNSNARKEHRETQAMVARRSRRHRCFPRCSAECAGRRRQGLGAGSLRHRHERGERREPSVELDDSDQQRNAVVGSRPGRNGHQWRSNLPGRLGQHCRQRRQLHGDRKASLGHQGR